MVKDIFDRLKEIKFENCNTIVYFGHYDNPQKAIKIFFEYIKPNVPERIRQDAKELVKQFNNPNDLDIALDYLVEGHNLLHFCEGIIQQDLCKQGFIHNAERALENRPQA